MEVEKVGILDVAGTKHIDTPEVDIADHLPGVRLEILFTFDDAAVSP